MIEFVLLLIMIYGMLWFCSMLLVLFLFMFIVPFFNVRKREIFGHCVRTWFNWLSFGVEREEEEK